MSHAETVDFVIIGGGAVGCGVAYSLARAGHTNVLVLERAPTLAAMTSSQAAGLVGQVRTSLDRTQLAMWSVKTFTELQEESGATPAWQQVGSLRIALTDARVREFDQMLGVAKQAGLLVERISAVRAAELWPAMSFERAKDILWCPSDGYLQPYDLTMAYAQHARRVGVRFETNSRVDEILMTQGRVAGVRTDSKIIHCKYVVNAAGAHAYHLARSVGLELPIFPVRHEFFVTIPAQLHARLPVVRIPDSSLYLRAETSALLCGGWERAALASDPHSFPLAGSPPAIQPDWDVLAWFAEQLAPEFPTVSGIGIRTVFKGWPTFTPDGLFIIGPSSRVPGFVMAGGCNAHGVSGSAGIGRHVVESLFEPNVSNYVKRLSPDRFDSPGVWDEALARARHYYSTYYSLAEL
jgi:glycine/D-amino acid oxidase-like deaminating enzyme